MHHKIIAMFCVLLLSGCTYLDIFYDQYGKDLADKGLAGSEKVNCHGAPVATVLRNYKGAKFFHWMEFCGHKIEGYTLVRDTIEAIQ